MITEEQLNKDFPWLKYVDEDANTGNKKLSKNTPAEIVKLYNEYKKRIDNALDKGIAIPKNELVGLLF